MLDLADGNRELKKKSIHAQYIIVLQMHLIQYLRLYHLQNVMFQFFYYFVLVFEQENNDWDSIVGSC